MYLKVKLPVGPGMLSALRLIPLGILLYYLNLRKIDPDPRLGQVPFLLI